MVTWATPADWKPYIGAAEKEHVAFLPLAVGQTRGSPGWCTYAEHIGDSPDVEILCGGMNSKSPRAAAVWHQGCLLHFGFEPSPAELNANGKALLENCIVYIARFRDDPPLAHTPSPFVDQHYPRPLRYLLGALRAADATPAAIGKQFAEPWGARVAKMDLDELRQWVAQNTDFLRAGKEGKTMLDEDAKDLGIPLGKSEFFDAALRGLGDAATSERTRKLLAARVPEGPGAGADAAAWTTFLQHDRPYLFFLEEGGTQWHLDPLAKARGVPCSELRGPRRATTGSASPEPRQAGG